MAYQIYLVPSRAGFFSHQGVTQLLFQIYPVIKKAKNVPFWRNRHILNKIKVMATRRTLSYDNEVISISSPAKDLRDSVTKFFFLPLLFFFYKSTRLAQRKLIV